jgi:hypothetical protein
MPNRVAKKKGGIAAARLAAAEKAKALQGVESVVPANQDEAPDVIDQDGSPAAVAITPPPLAPPGRKGFAQDRRQPNMRPEDLPEPEDVGEKEGPLDAEEAELFADCETALAEYFVAEATGVKALMNVQARRLYREQFSTFEEYTQDRFDRGRLWAYRQIERYQVSVALGVFPTGNKMLPESQARELAPVLKEHGTVAARQVWSQASDRAGDPARVTAKAIKEVREQTFPSRRQSAPATDPGNLLTTGELLVDKDTPLPKLAAAVREVLPNGGRTAFINLLRDR